MSPLDFMSDDLSLQGGPPQLSCLQQTSSSLLLSHFTLCLIFSICYIQPVPKSKQLFFQVVFWFISFLPMSLLTPVANRAAKFMFLNITPILYSAQKTTKAFYSLHLWVPACLCCSFHVLQTLISHSHCHPSQATAISDRFASHICSHFQVLANEVCLWSALNGGPKDMFTSKSPESVNINLYSKRYD